MFVSLVVLEVVLYWKKKTNDRKAKALWKLLSGYTGARDPNQFQWPGFVNDLLFRAYKYTHFPECSYPKTATFNSIDKSYSVELLRAYPCV